MNQKKINHMKHDSSHPEEIETLLKSFRPNPSSQLREHVANVTWDKPAPASQPSWKRKPWAVTAAAVLFLTLFMLSPAGRSLAQTISKFFQIAESETFSEVLPMDTEPMPTPDPAYPYNQFALTVEEASTHAGFTVKPLTGLSKEWTFHGASYDPEKQTIGLLYTLPSMNETPDKGTQDSYLYVWLSGSGFREFDWGLCPNGTIEKVKVNGWDAELSDGAVWVTTAPPEPGIMRVWECTAVQSGTTLALRWIDPEINIHYEISIDQFSESPSRRLNSDELIQLAENLK